MDNAFHYYSLALCIFQYFLPVLLMTYFYLMVATTIWKQQGTIQVQQSHTARNTRDLNMLNGRKKVFLTKKSRLQNALLGLTGIKQINENIFL
jgi:hypothetical protein